MIVVELTLWCDRCNNWLEVDGDTAEELREAAAGAGWRCDYIGPLAMPDWTDFCPDCKSGDAS